MNVFPRTVRNYVSLQGRVRLGNMGDAEPVGEGVFELRIHCGPGYRVYYGELERVVIILLCGGTKRSQRRDIERAKMYWQDLRSRSND